MAQVWRLQCLARGGFSHPSGDPRFGVAARMSSAFVGGNVPETSCDGVVARGRCGAVSQHVASAPGRTQRVAARCGVEGRWRGVGAGAFGSASSVGAARCVGARARRRSTSSPVTPCPCSGFPSWRRGAQRAARRCAERVALALLSRVGGSAAGDRAAHARPCPPCRARPWVRLGGAHALPRDFDSCGVSR